MECFEIESGKMKRKIGPGQPAFIIAEMSGNHCQSYARAKKIIDEAKRAGVDAVKMQAYTADTITMDCRNDFFRIKDKPWKGMSLHALYKKAGTPWKWQPKLKEYAESRGLFFFSTPFDVSAVDFLEKMHVPLYKVASFELCHIPLLKRIAKTGKPVILSRGLASPAEIELAIKTLRENGCSAIAVLHCIASYPALPGEMNLAVINDIGQRFDVVPGISDHSIGSTVSIASVCLGAKIIEKHLILSRKHKSPDASFSAEPKELKQLVESVREAEKMVGKPDYRPSKGEEKSLIFRPSIWVVKDMKKGETFSEKNIAIKRPGNGLSPKEFENVLGKKAATDLKRCTPLEQQHVAP